MLIAAQQPPSLWRSLPLVLALLALGSVAAPPGPGRTAEHRSSAAPGNSIQSSTSRQNDLARHLKRQGAVVYGAWWCPHCNHQKDLFGLEAIELLPYVECDKDDAGRKRCQEAQVKAYPTWELKGERRLGVLSLEELEIWSGYGSGTNSRH